MSKLVVILGPTASGKSALGMKLAQQYNGEIINADSRAVYRYMDIGTAKPSKSDMLLIPHHLVDIKNPNEPYSAAEFKRDASAAIRNITARHKLPIIVGGTGLYIDSLLFDYQFPDRENKELRPRLNNMSLDQLVSHLKRLDPEAAAQIDLKNPRRVMRAIETAGVPRSKNDSMRAETLVIGLSVNKEVIQKRISGRVEKMLGKALIVEVRYVGETFGWESEAMAAPAYKAFKDVILGDKTVAAASEEFVKRDVALAKRQITWFKRNQAIKWLGAEDQDKLLDEAKQLIQAFLE